MKLMAKDFIGNRMTGDCLSKTFNTCTPVNKYVKCFYKYVSYVHRNQINIIESNRVKSGQIL